MANPFAAADKILDRSFGERVRVEPQISGDYVTTGDPAREAWEVRAVIVIAPVVAQPENEFRDRPGVGMGLSGETVHVSAHGEAFAGRVVKQHDRIVLLDRPNETGLIIARVDRDTHGRKTLICYRAPRT